MHHHRGAAGAGLLLLLLLLLCFCAASLPAPISASSSRRSWRSTTASAALLSVLIMPTVHLSDGPALPAEQIEMLNTGELCDLTVVVGGEEFRAHRVALAGAS